MLQKHERIGSQKARVYCFQYIATPSKGFAESNCCAEFLNIHH